MAAITGNRADSAAAPATEPQSGEPTPRFALGDVPAKYWWLGGAVLVIAVMIISLAIWGPGMEYPTTVTYVASSDGSTSFPRSLRDVTGDAIDAGTKWVTVKGAWLFGGIKTAITYALNYLEDGLKWLPWPALVLGLTLASFAVGRWAMMFFTAFAFLFIGFMGLWEPMIDTVALMVVAVALSVGIGLPLGVLGARNQTADRICARSLTGCRRCPASCT